MQGQQVCSKQLAPVSAHLLLDHSSQLPWTTPIWSGKGVVRSQPGQLYHLHWSVAESKPMLNMRYLQSR